MKHYKYIASGITFVLLFSVIAGAHSGPYDGKTFKGRIAFSSDGNFNDEDDWGAFPVAAAILDAFGVTDKLVHVDYCNILADNDPRFYREMTNSVMGSVERYGIDRKILFDCQKDLDGAVESIKNAINASSADNPLYYILAGPMEVPYLGIVKSDPEKRKYVYCISHSVWNDGYTRTDKNLHRHNKRDVVPSGINWIQCRDGNRNLAHPSGVGKRSTPEQWRLYHWLRDSRDARLQWIFTRLEAEGRADISDATMTWFLLTGDEDADLAKLQSLLDGGKIPQPLRQRKAIRIEAENFRFLDGCKLIYGDRKASHRLCVGSSGSPSGSLKTTFDDLYALPGQYDIAIAYFDEPNGQSRFQLILNGHPQNAAWQASADDGVWRVHTIPNLTISPGDEIALTVQRDGKESARLDYVQLNHKGPVPASAAAETNQPK